MSVLTECPVSCSERLRWQQVKEGEASIEGTKVVASVWIPRVLGA